MHLIFDVLVNGEHALKRAVCFYIFSYRVYHRFSADNLIQDADVGPEAGSRPVRDFFTRWRPFKKQDRPLPLGENGAKREPDSSTPEQKPRRVRVSNFDEV